MNTPCSVCNGDGFLYEAYDTLKDKGTRVTKTVYMMLDDPDDVKSGHYCRGNVEPCRACKTHE